MLKKSFFVMSLAVALSAFTLAAGARGGATQMSAASVRQTTSTRTASATEVSPSPQEVIPVEREKPTPPRPRRTPTPKVAAPSEAVLSKAVRASFDSLVDGIRRADAEAVMKLFWNSQQLTLFNNNGTVTKSWEQARSNRESLYAKVKDVKLDVRDVRVKMLGPNAALVTCLWDQSQTADGQPEHTTGRLTLVYQKIGTDWKIIHTHSSPERPDPSLLSPSERERTTEAPPAKPEETPAKPPAKPPAKH